MALVQYQSRKSTGVSTQLGSLAWHPVKERVLLPGPCLLAGENFPWLDVLAQLPPSCASPTVKLSSTPRC